MFLQCMGEREKVSLGQWMEVDNSHNYIKEREEERGVGAAESMHMCNISHYTHTVAHVLYIILCTCMYTYMYTVCVCYYYSDSNQC